MTAAVYAAALPAGFAVAVLFKLAAGRPAPVDGDGASAGKSLSARRPVSPSAKGSRPVPTEEVGRGR